jgi:hypothetical protein
VQFVSEGTAMNFPSAFGAFWAHAPCSSASNFQVNMVFHFHGIEDDPSKREPFHDIVFHEKGGVYVISNWKTTNHSLTSPFSLDIHNTVLPRTRKDCFFYSAL